MDNNHNNKDMNILVKGTVQVRDHTQCVRKIMCLYTHFFRLYSKLSPAGMGCRGPSYQLMLPQFEPAVSASGVIKAHAGLEEDFGNYVHACEGKNRLGITNDHFLLPMFSEVMLPRLHKPHTLSTLANTCQLTLANKQT